MIECRHIDFSYDSKTILQGIDLNIENGEFLCILGQSGCGTILVSIRRENLKRVFLYYLP